MKRLALVLLVCAACKTEKKADPPPADNAAAVHHSTSRTPPPSLPPPNEVEGSDRPALADDGDDGSGRGHRHHHGWDGSAMTPEQREARFAEHATHMHDRLDTDGDGKVSYDELKNGTGRMMHFDDPAAIDTNHDGDISTDELLAAMKARRDAWRAQREAGAGTPAPADNGSN